MIFAEGLKQAIFCGRKLWLYRRCLKKPRMTTMQTTVHHTHPPRFLGQRVFTPSLQFDVETFYDAEAGYWVAACDAIHVVTEAPTLEALQDRFVEIAPEVMHENGQLHPLQSVVFTFVQSNAPKA